MSRPMLIGVCLLQNIARSRLGLELCVHVRVCTHMFVGICHFVFVHVCIFLHRQLVSFFFPRTHKDVHKPLSAQSPVGRRPRARPHIWQESNWACLMADIQERRRERQTCSDEGEWRAISRESWFPPSLCFLSTQHYNEQCFVWSKMKNLWVVF